MGQAGAETETDDTDTDTELAAEAEAETDRNFQTVISELIEARKNQHKLAVAFGLVSIVAALGGIWFLADQAAEAFARIQDEAAAGASDTVITAETVFLIVRGTGLAAVVGGLVYFLFNLTRSAVDQATRYEKRLIASYLIEYALHAEGVDAHKLDAAYKIVEVWGSTVESAYTPPRVAKRVGGFKYSFGKDNASMESDSNQP
jgi:hypothetical protein